MALVTEAIRTEVAQLYVALFGRAPLNEGLGYYAQKVASGMSIAQVAQEMYDLPVARSYYPAASTAEEVITSFFNNVLGREPADAGLAYWMGRLNAANLVNPTTAQGVVIAEMIDSVVSYNGANPTALDAKALFNNKVTVALAFREAQTSNPGGGFPAHLSDETLRDLSDDILKTVTADSNVSDAHAFVWNFLGGSAGFDLTSRRDVASGYETYNSAPDYTPGGDDFVNTLQDEDSLVGTAGNNDELNVLIGAPNDASESVISPVLRSIEVVNAEFTGGSQGLAGFYYAGYGGLLGEDIYLDNAYGLSFQNTEGVREVNIDRITDTNAYVVILSLQDSTTTLSLSDTRPVNGLVEFNWAEGELAGSDYVTLSLDNVRLNALVLSSGDWSQNYEIAEDEGYGIEHLMLNVDGTTNIDQFYLFPNGAEPVAGPAVPYYGAIIDVVPPGAQQIVEVTTAVGAPLEINSLLMPGVEDLVIHASAPVLFTGNERTNVDGNDNKGLDRSAHAFVYTGDLELIQIDGTAAGDVWLNGVNSGSDGDDTVVIEGSEMHGNLAALIDDATAGNADSSVDSGWGDDEIVTTGTSNMAITTRDGADHVHIGQFDGGDSNDVIRTGAGADRVSVQGTLRGDLDTWSAVSSNISDSAVKSDTAADGDTIMVVGVDSANISTGEGGDSIAVTNAILKTQIGSRTIDMAAGDDLLSVSGSAEDDISLAKGYAVEMGAGNDRASFFEDIAGTVSTSAGNDTVSVGGDVLEGANITTGADNDRVTVYDDVEATISTGTGDDYVQLANTNTNGIYDGDLEGTGSILTGEGNDTVNVGGDLDVAYADFVGFLGHSDDDGITTETDFDEEEEGSEYGITLNVPGTGKLVSNSHKTETAAADIDTGTGNDVVNVDGVLYSAPQWNDNLIDAGKVGNFNRDDTVNIIGSSISLGAGNDSLTIGDYDQRSDYSDPNLVEEGALIDAGADDDTVVINHNGPVVLAGDNTDFNPFGKSTAYTSKDDLTEDKSYDVYYVEREVGIGKAVGSQDTTGAMVYLGTGNDAITFNDVAFDVSGNPANRPAADSNNTWSVTTLLVDRGAILDGSAQSGGTPGSETDVMTVTTVDQIDVVASRVWHAIDSKTDSDSDTDSIVVGGLFDKDSADGQGGYIRNIDTINLVIENTVTPDEENYGLVADKEDPRTNDPAADGYVATDDDSNEYCNAPAIRIDEFQVNTDLNQINLVSNEQRLKLEDTKAISEAPEAKDEDPYYVAGHTNGFIAGQMTAFEIDSHRYDVALTLKAYEVTGLTPWQNGDLNKDGDLDGTEWPYEGFNPGSKEWVGEGYDLRDDCDIDVTVSVNMDAYAEWNSGATKNTGFTLALEANTNLANQTGEGNYDVEIISEDEYAADEYGNVITTDEDDTVTGNMSGQTVSAEGMDAQDVNALADDLDDQGSLIRQYARDITLNVNTGASHSIQMDRTFVGNSNFLGSDTSLTVNVSNGAGQALELHDVRADKVTASGASDLYLYMVNDSINGQPFNINLSKTTGNNLIDMVWDGYGTEVAFDDTVTGGSGHDMLLIAGGYDIASFASIKGVESLAVIFDEGSDATSDLNVDASGALNEILIANYNKGDEGIADSDDDFPIGEDGFHTVNVTVSGAASGADALVINADIDISEDLEPPFCNPDEDSTRHSDNLLINAETKGAERTDLDIWVNTAEGTQVRLKNEANEFARVYATVSALADTYVNDNEDPLFNAGGNNEGELKLSVVAGGVDEIYLVNADRSTGTTAEAQGTGSGHNVFVKVEDTWATNVDVTAKAYDLKIDASAINTTDDSTFNVWNELDGSAETDANLYIIGTQDRDDIDGGVQNDTLDGQAGNDLLYGHRGNDSLVGGTGNDQLAGDDDGDTIAHGGNDTLRGGDGADLLYGGVKADILTGGKDNDTFTYTRRADSNSGYDDAGIDTITDFNNNGELTDTVPGQDVIDVRNLAFDPAPLNFKAGETVGEFLHGKKMVFGSVDEVSTLLLGGNGKNFADAQARTFEGNEVIEVVYQQDESVLWFDLNDDGTLNNNDLRIHVELPAGESKFKAEWINGIQANGDGYTDFFQAVHSDPTQNKGAVYSLGTVVNDHVLVDADQETGGYVTGLQNVAHGGLATYGGNDQVTVLGSNSSDDLIIDLGDGNDTLAAGAGDETLIGGEGNDSIAAGNGDDDVYGGNGDDTVFGEAGADYIEATPGNDYLDGGVGHDTLISSSGNDTLFGRDGDDHLVAGTSSDFDYAGEGDQDYVDGGSGNDYIETGDEADIAYGGTGNDDIWTDDGADFVDAGSDADDVWSGNGDDTVWGGTGNDDLFTSNGNDWVDAGSDDDWVLAGEDNDTVYGQGGEDWVEGGEGDDLIVGGGGSDDEGDILFGGDAGIEQMLLSYILFNPPVPLPNLESMSGAMEELLGDFGLLLDNDDGKDTLYGDLGEDIITGGGGDDVLSGGVGEDFLFGDHQTIIDWIPNLILNDSDVEAWEQTFTGDDVIDAGSDDDYVEGGMGADTIDGGEGDDALFGDWGTFVINGGPYGSLLAELGGMGEDLIDAIGNDDVIHGGTGEDYIVAGGGDDVVTGDEGEDDIYGNAGDDAITAGAGEDWVHGGNGDDTITGDGGEDLIYGDAGDDSIDAGTFNDTVSGDEGGDWIHGRGGEDFLFGEDGDDTIYGGDPTDSLNDDDTISGGTGDDIAWGFDGEDMMSGDAGNDTLYGGDEHDLMAGGDDDDLMAGEEGSDFMSGGVGYALVEQAGTHHGVDVWSILDDGDGNDTMTGDLGDDVMFGGGADDNISGGNGDDDLFGDYAVSDDLLYWADSVDGTIGASDEFSDVYAGNDIIFGNDGSDEIQGGFGDDTLDGGDDDDLIFGEYKSAGYSNNVPPGVPYADYWLANSGEDIVDPSLVAGGSYTTDGNDDLIFGGWGNDTILGDISYDISDFDSDEHGIGGDDTLYGEDGNDLIAGGGGDDLINGGDGMDGIIGGHGDDSIYGGNEDDLIYGWDEDDYIDGGEDDDSIFGGEGDDTLVGDTGPDSDADNNDSIWGGTGDDSIDGGADGDDLYGDEGDDTIFGGNGDDDVWGGDGDDSIFGEEDDDDVFGGDGDDTIYGGTGDDDLRGESDDDVIHGGDGDDDLRGGSDDDWLWGEEDDDDIYAEEGADSVFGGNGDDFVQLDDGAGNVSDDTDDIDWVHLDVASTSDVNYTSSDDLNNDIGTDTIDGFDTSDPVFDSNDASDTEPDQGDWLVLLTGDVTNGVGGATVTLTDWSNDAYYTTSDSPGGDDTDWYYNDDPAYDTVGAPNVSIANARLVIVRTQGEDDQGVLPAESYPGTSDGSSSDNTMGDDFDYDYTSAEDVDMMLAGQNGAFNGSVFVLTDDAGRSDGYVNETGTVYLWWDADVADQNYGAGKTDTVLVGTFTSIDDAEAFLGNVQWLASWPTA